MNRRDFLRHSGAAGVATALPLPALASSGIPTPLWEKAVRWAPDIDGHIPDVLTSWFKIDPAMSENIFKRLLAENIVNLQETPMISGVLRHKRPSIEDMIKQAEKLRAWAEKEEEDGDEQT